MIENLGSGAGLPESRGFLFTTLKHQVNLLSMPPFALL